MNKLLHNGLILLMLAAPALTVPALAAPEPTKKPDSTELPGSDVVGNRELPVGLDIVPWRPSAAGEVREGPTQLLDVPLEPIDPIVFRRQLEIYQSSQQP